MSISGKMSVGVVLIDVMPSNRISSAITTNVYGRRRANLTIHISRREPIALDFVERAGALTNYRASCTQVADRDAPCAFPPNRAATSAGNTISPTPFPLSRRERSGRRSRGRDKPAHNLVVAGFLSPKSHRSMSERKLRLLLFAGQ